MNLSNTPDKDGNVDIIANKTRNNYVNFEEPMLLMLLIVYTIFYANTKYGRKDNVISTKNQQLCSGSKILS